MNLKNWARPARKSKQRTQNWDYASPVNIKITHKISKTLKPHSLNPLQIGWNFQMAIYSIGVQSLHPRSRRTTENPKIEHFIKHFSLLWSWPMDIRCQISD